MYIPEHNPEEFHACSVLAGRRHCARAPLTALVGGVALVGLTLLTACGGGEGCAPTDPNCNGDSKPIPELLFEVTMSNPSNTCQLTEDLGAYRFVTLPQHADGNSYDLLGVLGSPVPAQFTADKLVFHATVTGDSGVVTLGADWLFSSDRQSFTGSTTLDVRLVNGKTCLFTFGTAGVRSVVSSLGSVPSHTQPSGAAAATRITALYTAAGGIGHIYSQSGNPGRILNSQPAECYSDGVVVLGGSRGGLTAGPANATGSNPVAVGVYFVHWDEASGFTTQGQWDFGGNNPIKSGPVFAEPANHDWLYVSPAVAAKVTTVFMPGGGLYNSSFLLPMNVGGSSAVVAQVPTVRLVNPPPGWYQVWVRYDWWFTSGSLFGQAWLAFDDAQSYAGTAQIASNGWCYVSG